MTCAITNPMEEKIREAIFAANVMMNHDENCQVWLANHRSNSEVAGGEAAARRERRTARRATRGAGETA
jgi:hypothetical protein